MFDQYFHQMHLKEHQLQISDTAKMLLVIHEDLLESISYLLLVSFYMVSGGPTLVSKEELRRKYDVLTFSCSFFLFPLVQMLCDCMIQRGTSLCRSVLCTVCCYGLFPRGLCVHSYPKNRPPLWQHGSRLTCDMRERFLSICLTPSLLSSPLSLSVCLSSSNIMHFVQFFLCKYLSFLLYSSHLCSLHYVCLCLPHDCSSKNSTDT